jgi:hypothetical protein
MKTLGIASLVLAFSLLPGPVRSAHAAETDAEAEANRVAHDHVLCRKYGYEESSDDFAHCLEVLANRRTDAVAKATTERRKTSSQQRAISAAESNGCNSRDQVINGGGRGPTNAHETAGTCGH